FQHFTHKLFLCAISSRGCYVEQTNGLRCFIRLYIWCGRGSCVVYGWGCCVWCGRGCCVWCGRGWWVVLGQEGVMFRKQKKPLDAILKFPNVPWPSIFNQAIHQFLRQFPYFTLVTFGICFNEVVAKSGYVFSTVAQGRQIDSNHIEAKIEILPK